jgi:K+-sensing histidine kinase KdpD
MDSVSLESVLETCWERVETKTVTLDIESAPVIRADRKRVEQVFENLFQNAVKHGDENGRVRVGRTDDCVYVEDDGPGILPDNRDEIFDMGYTTHDAGTGFGLCIVKEIVHDHEWSLTVTDGRTGGARFEISGLEFVDTDVSPDGRQAGVLEGIGGGIRALGVQIGELDALVPGLGDEREVLGQRSVEGPQRE